MKKVITYGTYDFLHYGHIRLLERAKALGDYLIVGVTADDFDKTRGKINVHQSLMERVEAVRATGIADEIIIEEYEGQKIDDILKYDVDIFTVGSDWIGKFDYLKKYCEVIYIDRTEGVSSSEIRSKQNVRIGLIGDINSVGKFYEESKFVNGIEVVGVYTENKEDLPDSLNNVENITSDYQKLLELSDAVYIHSAPSSRASFAKRALLNNKHVLCESPLAFDPLEAVELQKLADANHVVLMETMKTAYVTAFERLLLLAKSGKIGDIVLIDSTCTSLKQFNSVYLNNNYIWGSFETWGPTALLPVFKLFGPSYESLSITTKMSDGIDAFDSLYFIYKNAIANVKVANSVKSEGELLISGTKGYIYVPAPWWKTDYFEIRYENSNDNKKYFYQIEGEGIRYEIVAFVKTIETGNNLSSLENDISNAISKLMQKIYIERQINVLK